MDRQHYNRLKAANKQVQSDACISFARREQARPLVKVVLVEKEKTGMWHSERMGRNLGIVSRWMTTIVQPSVEQLCDIANVDVRELLVSSRKEQ